MSKQYPYSRLQFLCTLAMAVAGAGSAFAQSVVVNDERATDGYRLISRLNQNKTKLIDRSGATVHEWNGNYGVSTLAALQPDGTLLRTCATGNTSFLAGGNSGRTELLDWEGNVVWSYELNTPTQVLHHDVKRMPNGNFLFLTWHLRNPSQSAAAGVDPSEMGARGVLFERIIEVKPSYPAGGEIVWEWDLFDHILQDRFADQPNFGDAIANPGLVNVHAYATKQSPDWFHANAVDYNPALDQIAISVRNYSELWIIDHSTTTEQAASHSGGRYGKGGDLLYRWGNPEAWSAGTEQQRQLGYQHNVQWIEPGLPGEGHLLIFSNGDPLRPDESQIVEIELPLNSDGSYALSEGAPYGPEQPSWTYSANEPGEFSSAFISGVQRLPNGNTLICSGQQATVFEVNPEGEVLWKFLESREDEQFVMVFRANWYPASFPGFFGTPVYQPEPESPARKGVKK